MAQRLDADPREPRFSVHDGVLTAIVPLRGMPRRIARGFAMTWAVVAIVIGFVFSILGFPVGLAAGTLALLAGVWVWRRRDLPMRVKFRKGARSVSVVGPTSFVSRPLRDHTVRIRTESADGGYRGIVTVEQFDLAWGDVRSEEQAARDAVRSVVRRVSDAIGFPIAPEGETRRG